MTWPTYAQVLEIHDALIRESGGSTGVRDMNAIESALSQPFLTFDRVELYPSLADKCAALCYFLVRNHPFVDGNKRIGHAAMDITLQLNGYEIIESVDIQEKKILDLAAGAVTKDGFLGWVRERVVPRGLLSELDVEP